MPLIESGSRKAVSENIRREMDSGKSQKQSVAIALDVARRAKRATGGRVHVGALRGDTGGRADEVPVDVPANSYVIPADVISGMGEGNTENGLKILDRMFGVESDGADHEGVPIQAAHGEYVIAPEKVEEIGGGDMKKGHKILDDFVVLQRKKIIKTMERLPGPAKR